MDQLHFFPAQWDSGYKDNWALEVTGETKPCVCARASGAAFILGAVLALSPARQRCWHWSGSSNSQRAADTAVKEMQSPGQCVMGKATPSLPWDFCEVCRAGDPDGADFTARQSSAFCRGIARLARGVSPFTPSGFFAARAQAAVQRGRGDREATGDWVSTTRGLQRGRQQSTWEKWLPAMREVNRQIREGRQCLQREGRSSALTEFGSSARRQGSKYLPGLGMLLAAAPVSPGEVPVCRVAVGHRGCKHPGSRGLCDNGAEFGGNGG